MNGLLKAELLKKYRNSKRKAILLDYDGTLVDHTLVPETNRLSGHLFEILIKLLNTPHTEVYIITGRNHLETDEIFTHLPITIIAEHGALIKENGLWRNQIPHNDSWKKKIFPILDQISLLCPGSFVEEKYFSLAWHYRSVDPEAGYLKSRELISILETVVQSYDLKILDGNKIVEIISTKGGKGNAVKKLCENKNFEFILSIGDDVTDEEMFEYLQHNPNAYTIKVGKGDTLARFKLASSDDVLLLLKQLSL